jgi:hypothetical protein
MSYFGSQPTCFGWGKGVQYYKAEVQTTQDESDQCSKRNSIPPCSCDDTIYKWQWERPSSQESSEVLIRGALARGVGCIGHDCEYHLSRNSCCKYGFEERLVHLRTTSQYRKSHICMGLTKRPEQSGWPSTVFFSSTGCKGNGYSTIKYCGLLQE